MKAIIIAAAVILLLFAVYVFILARPRGKAPQNKRLLGDYAHRGLHGDGVPENSLAAFEVAYKAGYGIELDVQLSRDGEVMVFHDYTLSRMTGADGQLSELDCAELEALRLNGTDEKIPTLKEVLELVNGRVPILVELKGESADTAICKPVSELLSAYCGDYLIESFNPLLLWGIKKYLPDAYVGLLYTNVCREKKKVSLLNLALSAMMLNFLAKPNFIAYDEKYRNSFFVKLTTRFWRSVKFVWTLKGSAAVSKAHSLGEYPIFELQQSFTKS